MADVSQIKLPNGSVYDLIDEKSGYITAEYIENKTDYEIPVSRVGEIVVGETAIGTDSTNFPTSKAVVDYVDERVVQEIAAIDFDSGITGIQANGTSLPINNGVVNIPAIGPGQSVGLMTDQWMQQIWNGLHSIPTSTSQLTNDSGFITSETDPTVPAWAKASTKPTYTASEVGALPDSTVIPEDKVFIAIRGTTSLSDIFTAKDAGKIIFCKDGSLGVIWRFTGSSGSSTKGKATFERIDGLDGAESMHSLKYLQLSHYSGQESWSVFTRTIPYRTSDLTNDSGYLTISDIASVMTYKGTKANYAALPSTGNTTGDVWHLTDTGAEWAWDGSAWQELGTAIDLSNYLTTSDIAAWAKASTKPTYTATEVGALPDTTTIPSKTSDLTNDSGFITSYTDEKVKTDLIPSTSASYYLTLSSSSSSQTATLLKASELSVYYTSNSVMKLILGKSNVSGMIRLYKSGGYYIDLGVVGSLSANRSIILPNKDGTIALTSDIPTVPTKVSDLTNDSGFISSYTETDPVFSASAAAGITSTDISNWNAKVSDTGKWNGVELANFETATANDYYVPAKTTVGSTSGTASWLKVTRTPGNYSIAQYDNGYLKSTTPSANDNSKKVATTAYVDAAIPDTSGFVSKSGDTMSGDLTFAYNNGIIMTMAESTSLNTPQRLIRFITIGQTGSGNTAYTNFRFKVSPSTQNQAIQIGGIHTPEDTDTSYDTYIASKKYVDDSIPKVYSSTNTGGYLTMATLPIYDGAVV